MSEEEVEDETMTYDSFEALEPEISGQGQGTSLTGSGAKSCRLPVQTISSLSEKPNILPASKKVHLGQRPKNDEMEQTDLTCF